MEKTVLSKPPSLYAGITAKIMAAIEAGAGAFELPWHRSAAGIGRPCNAATGAKYRGVNVVALWSEAVLAGFSSGQWATYRQWRTLDAQVRRGERGALIVFYGQIDRPDDNPEEDDSRVRRRMLARASYVFNVAQIDGWSPPDPQPLGATMIVEAADALVSRSGADVRFGGDQAYYDPQRDRICMPERRAFRGTATSSPDEAFYATLLHELVHWSGATSRLSRPFGRFGSEAYAREELVALSGQSAPCLTLH